jgi:hypothetical protein
VAQAQPSEAPPDPPKPKGAHPEPKPSHTVSPFPSARGLQAFVPADALVQKSTHMKEAIALANALLPAIQGTYELEFRRVTYEKDEMGRLRQRIRDEKALIQLTAAPFAQSVEALPPPEPGQKKTVRYGLTPPRSVDRFQVDLDQARAREVEQTAKTLVHEWAHTALNRQLSQLPDGEARYAGATDPVGLFESLRFRSPATGEFVQVTPSGPGVTEHEMVAQFSEHLFDLALAQRKKARR